MIISTKNVLFSVLILFSISQLQAQYQSTDFVSTGLLSNDIHAPGRMSVDVNGILYIADSYKKSIVKYDEFGNHIATILTDFRPISVAATKKKLFVADQNTGNIYLVQTDGSKSIFYSGLSFPASMSIGPHNSIFVVDSKLKKVIKLSKNGSLLLEFTYTTFTYPTGIAFDALNERIIVSEHGGIGPDVQNCGGGCSICWGTDGPVTTIYIFDINGNYISEFGCFGTDDGLFQRIQGVTVDADGNIFATDPYLGRVSVFDPDGNFITIFGQQGDGLGEFNLPMDVVFSPDNRIYVSSMNKGAVDIFSTPMSMAMEEMDESLLDVNEDIQNNGISNIEQGYIDIYPNPSTGEFTIRINPVDPISTNIQISIYGLSGKLIYLEEFDPKNASQHQGSILKSINIEQYAKGLYIVNVIAGDFSIQKKLVLKD